MYAFILKYTSLLLIKRQEIYCEINFLKKKWRKVLQVSKKALPLHPQSREMHLS